MHYLVVEMISNFAKVAYKYINVLYVPVPGHRLLVADVHTCSFVADTVHVLQYMEWITMCGRAEKIPPSSHCIHIYNN